MRWRWRPPRAPIVSDWRGAQGALHGLPCTVKESFDVQGWLTTSGAHYLKDNRATQDAPSIARLRAAGAILMGKPICADDDCRLANL